MNGKRESPPGAPPDLHLLVFLREATSRGEATTQTAAVLATGRSQPTVSRALTRLKAKGSVRVRAVWGGVESPRETAYSLTLSGAEAAERAVRLALEEPSGEPGLRLGDLMELFPELTLSNVLSLDARGRARDVRGLSELRAELAQRPRAWATVGPQGGGTAEPPLVGRWNEQVEILGRLRALKGAGARGSALVLIGGAGMGKSRLLRFATTVARHRNIPVEIIEPDGPAPGTGEPSRDGERRGSRVPPSNLVGPRVLVMDDLQRATPRGIANFRRLCQHLPTGSEPVLLLASARDDEPFGDGGPDAFPDLLEELRRPAGELAPTRLLLPLSDAAADELRAWSASTEDAHAISTRLWERVRSQCRGNPAFLLEALDILRRTGDGALPVLPSVHRLLEGRLQAVSSEDRVALEAASLLDEEFDAQPLEALSGEAGLGSPLKVAQRWGTLADRGVLLVRRGKGRFSFANPAFQEAASERLPERERWARALASWWEERRPWEVRRIAELYRASRDPERALPWFRQALELSLRSTDRTSCESLVEGMREMVTEHPSHLPAHLQEELRLLERLWLLGDHRVVERIALGLLRLGVPPKQRILASCLLLVSLVFDDPAQAERALLELPGQLRELPPEDRRETQGVLDAAAAHLHAWWGRADLALRETGTALAALPRKAEPVWRTSALVTRAACLVRLRRYRAGLEVCAEAERSLSRSPPSVFHAQILDLRASAENLTGRRAEGRRHRERSVLVAREVGNPRVLARLLSSLVLCDLTRDRVPEATRELDELRELVHRFALSQLRPWISYREGQMLWKTGAVPESLLCFHEALAGFRASSFSALELLPRAYLTLEEGRRRDVRSFWAAWYARRETLDPEEVGSLAVVLGRLQPPGRDALGSIGPPAKP